MPDLRIDTKSPLAGTVKYHEHHLIVCSGHTTWPAQIEEEGDITGDLVATLKVSPLAKFLRINTCDRPSAGPGTDILL